MARIGGRRGRYGAGALDWETALTPILTHEWNVSPAAAAQIQQRLARRVIRRDDAGVVTRIAGVDVAYDTASNRLVAGVAIIDAQSLALIETHIASDVARFDYVPGLFAFREAPAIIAALAKVDCAPDLIVCDGHGIAHPRRLGLASHIGLLFDVPTIGCAKTSYIGTTSPVDVARGSQTPIIDDHEIIGASLRTQHGVNPVYVSTGHRISLDLACDWILRLTPRFRLPETTRYADQAVKRALASEIGTISD